MTMTLDSAAFAAGGTIPERHTCDGEDLSPHLAWAGVPAEARSLVLIVDDPDAPDPAAPRMTWVHWLLYNIPPGSSGLAEGVALDELPAGTLQGFNDWRRCAWGGPCPPIGRHRYVHQLLALDVVLPDLHRPTRATLEAAMAGHVLARAEHVGLYARRAGR